MNTFLDEVANKIVASDFELDQTVIVLPTNRSKLFLKKALSKLILHPTVAPNILSIEEFVFELSNIRQISNISLLYEFYSIYKKHTPSELIESFDQYLNWATAILKEFNEIDAYSVDSDALFKYLAAHENIANWGIEKETSLIKNHRAFNERLPVYYSQLYNHLLDLGRGYAGMQIREAVKNLPFYIESNQSYHYFVGFNALNNSEVHIVNELIFNEQAEIIWDIDNHFYHDLYHPSGHFIRKYHKEWNCLKKSKPKFQNHFQDPKRIEIIGIAKNVGQAKYAAQIVNDLKQKKPADSIALVLGEESLLVPTLSGVSAFTNKWNVTMGYALKETSVASLFNTFLELHQRAENESYDFFSVESLLESCSTHLFFKHHNVPILNILESYKKINLTFIPFDRLLKFKDNSEAIALYFEPFTSVSNFLKRLIKICDANFSFHNQQKTHDSKLISAYFIQFQRLFRQLSNLQERYGYLTTIEEIKILFNELLRLEKVNFIGEPYGGIQIMGLLETRLLDFENVIITNLNEGILPLGKGGSQLIPFEIRKKFGLPTFLEKDYIFSYHFFRLLQRAKNIYLLYNSNSDGVMSGEKSRFLYQLEFLKLPNHEIVLKQIGAEVELKKVDKKEVQKSESIYQKLIYLSEQGFSPSSLTQYIRNPYEFYEQRVLGIRAPKTLEDSINAMDKGTLIHETLETLYLPFLNKPLTTNHFDQILAKLPNVLRKKFKAIYHGGEYRTGRNYIIFEVVKKLLINYFNREKQVISDGNSVRILSLEKPFETQLDFPSFDFPIKLKGKVDRVDELNDTIRIIDYKTGTLNKRDLCIENWNEIRTEPKKNALFQVLLYSYVLKDQFSEKLQAGVIRFLNYENDFIPVSMKNNSQKENSTYLNTDILSDYEVQLKALLKDIFDVDIPFENND